MKQKTASQFKPFLP